MVTPQQKAFNNKKKATPFFKSATIFDHAYFDPPNIAKSKSAVGENCELTASGRRILIAHWYCAAYRVRANLTAAYKPKS